MSPRICPWRRYLLANRRETPVLILHSRDGPMDMQPDPRAQLQAGDHLCVLASLDVLNRLARLNRGEAP